MELLPSFLCARLSTATVINVSYPSGDFKLIIYLGMSFRTDLCFHVVRDNRVVNPDEALKIIIATKVDPVVAEIYRNQSVQDVDVS